MPAKRPEYRFAPNPHEGRNRKRAERAIAHGGKPEGTLRIRLDARTILTLSGTKRLEWWRERYPALQILP